MMLPDQDARNLARLRLDSNVVVEAAAGTGKTTLLTDRFLFLMLGGDADIAKVVSSAVALTFTEKAAGAIKLRIVERLSAVIGFLRGDALGDRQRREAEEVVAALRSHFGRKDDAILERAGRLLEELDKARIETIHAFASHLLRLFPIEGGVSPDFEVDEGDAFSEIFTSEWRKWLDEELAENAPRQEDWLDVLEQATLEDLREVALVLCGESVDLEAIGMENENAAARVESLGEALRGPAWSEAATHLAQLASAARSKAIKDIPAERFAEPKKSKGQAEGEEDLEEALAVCRLSSAGQEFLLRRTARLLLPFARSFRKTFTRLGYVSFDGLLRKARDLARDHLPAREEIKRRYKTFLIDEFQDTDPLQGELLLFLAEAEGGHAKEWSRMKLGQGRLFVVGDPKQSIYRFRGADIAAYQQFTAHILKDPRSVFCGLQANFRSLPEILDPVNTVFKSLMVEREALQPAYQELKVPAKSLAGKKGSVEIVLFGPSKAGADEIRQAQAAWISRWIIENCGEGKLYRLNDVAILLRSSTPAASIIETFKEQRIPYAVDMEKYFYGAQEVIDFVNLLRVLDDPKDPVALAGLLRSPLGAIQDRTLYQLARQARLDYESRIPSDISSEEKRRLSALYAGLKSLRSQVGRLPLGRMVREILRQLPVLELDAAVYHESHTVSNLLKLARLAEKAGASRGLTLREFTELAAGRIKEDTAEGESPLADENLDAVRILTIHKAKGLEFPVVFFGDVSAPGGRDAGVKPALRDDWQTGLVGLRLPKANVASAAMAWLEVREKKRQEHEAVRLLYVALTRAKEKLFILGKEAGVKGSFSVLLDQAGAWPKDGDSAMVNFGSRGVVKVSRVMEDDEALSHLEPWQDAPLKRVAPDPEVLSASWQRRRQLRDQALATAKTVSPTDYLKDDAASMKREPQLSEASLPNKDNSQAAWVGRVCHRVLERWDFARKKTFEGRPLEAGVKKACQELRALASDAPWDQIETESEKLLAGFVSSAAAEELGKAEILGREVPFIASRERAVMRGFIDLIYRKDGRVYVADYKTDRVSPQSVAKLREKYRGQGGEYQEAARKALNVKDASFRLIFLRRPDLA